MTTLCTEVSEALQEMMRLRRSRVMWQPHVLNIQCHVTVKLRCKVGAEGREAARREGGSGCAAEDRRRELPESWAYDPVYK